MPVDVRPQIVALARDAVTAEHIKHDFFYEEVRPLPLVRIMPAPQNWDGDCSWFCKTVYWEAGVSNDPTGCNWNGWGNTVSLWNHGQHITQAELLPGDIIVFGPDGDVHGVVCVEVGPDPLCASMGRQGDPSLVPLSVLRGLGEPTFLRFNTTDEAATPVRARPVSAADIKKAQLVQLPNPESAKLALENHWTVFIWNEQYFIPSVGPHPAGTHEYANVHYKFKRP